MKINKEHALFEQFINNEYSTLKFIGEQSDIYEFHQNLCSKSYEVHNQYLGLAKKKPNIDRFSFECDFSLIVEGKPRLVCLESIITKDFDEASYCIYIHESEDLKSSILRKFHFDYAPNETKGDKPIYHLQYGGKATPVLQNKEIDCENLKPWLSVPRLNIIPTNIALMIDFILNEFDYSNSYSFLDKSEWRNLVKTNEDLVLKTYFQNITSFFNSTHNQKKLYRDFYYGRD